MTCSCSEGMSSVCGCHTEEFPVRGTGSMYGFTGQEATCNTRGWCAKSCLLALSSPFTASCKWVWAFQLKPNNTRLTGWEWKALLNWLFSAFFL